LIASRSKLCVTDAQQGSAGVRGDNLTISRPFGGVIEKLINGQCIGLHTQAKYVQWKLGPPGFEPGGRRSPLEARQESHAVLTRGACKI
jgi:hypothetical protein